MSWSKALVSSGAIIVLAVVIFVSVVWCYFIITGMAMDVGNVEVPSWLSGITNKSSWLNFISSDPSGNTSGIGPKQSNVALTASQNAPVCWSAKQSSGSNLVTMPCTGAANQSFTYDNTDMSLKLGDSNLCIDAHDNQNNEPLTVHDCNQSAPQKWMPTSDGSFRYNGTNRCIQMTAANPVGQTVKMSECTGGAAEKWSWNTADGGASATHQLFSSPAVPKSNTIKYAANDSMCWEISPGKKGFTDGAKLHLAKCTGAPGQMMSYDPETLAITVDGTDQCIDLHSATNGYQLQSHECNNTGPQMWSFNAEGKIMYSGAGKAQCVDLHGGSAVDGTPINMYDCYSTPNQNWKV